MPEKKGTNLQPRSSSTRTGRCLLQQGLYFTGELDDVLRRSGPEHKAVPRVLKARLDARVLQPEQEGVDEDLLEL